MISAHTIPGTKVICIDASGSSKYQIGGFDPSKDAKSYLTLNNVYTVDQVCINEKADVGFSVVLKEIKKRSSGDRGYSLSRFRPAVLPKSIMDCLTVTKKKIEEFAY